MALFNLQEFEKHKNSPVPETAREGRKQLDELVHALTDPIVLHRSPWADTLPEWVRGQIIMERMAALIKGDPGMATDAEAMAYIYPASLDAPLDHDWSEIYLYVSTKTMEKAGKTVPPDIRVDKLDNYRMGLLRDLKRSIYNSRAKHKPKGPRDVRYAGTMDEGRGKTKEQELVADVVPLFAEM
jgi:hypothetical protein